MKITKKVIIPAILLVILVGIFAFTSFNNSKYPLPNVRSSEIKAMSIYNNGNSVIKTVHNRDGQKLLKHLKGIIKDSNIEENDAQFIYDNFSFGMSSKYMENYYVEVPFSRMQEISFKNDTIKCDMLVIDVDNNIIYYHNSESYTLQSVKVESDDFEKFKKFLSSI